MAEKWYLILKFYAFQSCGVCLIHDSYCNLISISGCEIKLFDMFLNCRWTFKIEFKILFAFVKFVVKFSMRIGLTLVLVLRWLLVITVTHTYIRIMQSIQWWIYRKVNPILYLSHTYISINQAFQTIGQPTIYWLLQLSSVT